MHKCHNCLHYLLPEDLIEGKCPICLTTPEPSCECNKTCHCPEDVNAGIQYCSSCKKPVCKCGSSDVEAVSRVTGYLAAVSGWGAGKRAELNDRSHYDPLATPDQSLIL